MAKKVVASLRDTSGVKYAKLIKSVKSEKTGSYVFKEEIVIEDHVKDILAGKTQQDIINEIKNAINLSNIGLNAQDNGEMIIINIPALTEERRIQLVKQVKAETENARVAIRNSRKDGNDELKKIHKSGSISDDLLKDAESSIQKFTDQFIEKANKISSLKEEELMKV